MLPGPCYSYFLPLLGFGPSTIATLLRVLLAGVSLIGAAARRFPERVVNANGVLVAFVAFEAGALFTDKCSFACTGEVVEDCII